MLRLARRTALCTVATLALLLAVPAAHGKSRPPKGRHGPHGEPGVPPVVLTHPDHVLKRLDSMVERIAAARAIADVSTRGDARARLLQELEVLREEANLLRERVRQAPPVPERTVTEVVVVQPEEPEVPPAPTAMDSGAFGDVMAAIEKEGFEDGRIRVIGDVAEHGWFSVAQVKRVIEALTYSKEKLAALSAMAPRIVDPANTFKIYDSFTYDSDKKEARRILSEAR